MKKMLAIILLIGTTSFSYPSGWLPTVIPSNTKILVDSGIVSIDYAPTFTNCPSDINNVMPDPGDCTAIVSWTPPTASGSGPVTMTSNYSPGDSFYPGTHRVIYRATDSSGDTSFCEFRVTVLDNQAPIITVPADITRSADPGSCGAVVTFPYPTASENCPAGEGAPIDESFDGGTDLSTQCYDFDGTFVGDSGAINGSAGELETVELINNDIRSFTSPLTQFNSTGEIFFDHRIIAGSPSGNIGNNARLTVKLITTGGVETIIYNELYVDEDVRTEYIPISQSGNYYVQFEWETGQNRNDIAYLDNLYIPGYVVSDTTVVTCDTAAHRVVQIAGQPYRSGREFPVGTTTLEYLTRDAAGNVGFNSFKVTVTNNINPPDGDDVEYCEGDAVPTLTVSVGSGQTVDWYDAAVGGTLLLAGNTSYQPPGPGDYYAETRNVVTGCVSSTRRRIRVTENPQPVPPSAPSPIEYCVNDPATPLTATGDAGNMIFWYDAPTGGNMYPNAPTPDTSTARTTFYYVEQVDATTGCISDRTEVVVTVYSLPLAPMVITPVEYCIDEMSEELNSSVTSGSNLRWYDAASGGNEIPGTTRPDTSSAGQQFFWVTQSSTSGSTNCESTRTRLTVNVNMPPAITMQPIDRSACENENVTFAVGASDAASYQWQVFDGTTWNDLSDTAPYSNTGSKTMTITAASLALNGNRYRAVVSSPATSCADAISNDATLAVNTAPPAPTSGGDQTECEQDPIQTLTATATPPSGATVVWYDAASGGNIVANPILDTVGTVTYYAESNDLGNGCPSVGRTPVTLTIEAIPAPPVSGGDQTECEADPTQTMTATASAPSGATIDWYDAASGGNSVANPILNTVGTVTYFAESRATGSGCTSNGRTPVTLTMNARPTISVTPASQSCSPDLSTYSVSFDVDRGTVTSSEGTVADNGGNNWTVSGITSGNDITVTVTDANSCSENLAINAPNCGCPTVGAPTSGGDRTECEADPIQTLTATATPPSGASIVWYDAATNGNTVASPALNTVGTVTYYAESEDIVNGCTSSARTPVTLTLQGAPSEPTSGGDQTECEQSPTQTLTATATCAAGTNIVWYDAASGGNTVANPVWNSIGTITYYAESRDNVTDCASHSRTAVTLTIQPNPAAPTSGGDQTECEINPIQTLTATANAPAGSSIVWYDTATGGNVVATPTLNAVGTITYYAESNDSTSSCTGFNRTAVTLTIHGLPDVVANATDTNINAGEPVTLTGSGADTYVWDNGVNDGDTVFPFTTTTYTVMGTDGNGCENTDSVTVTVGATSDILLEKTVDIATPNVGDTVTFTLTATNDGPNDDTGGSVIRDLLPIGFTYVGDNGNAANGTYDDASGNWTLPALANGSSVSLEIAATVNPPTAAASEYENSAEVIAATNYDNDSTPNNDDGDQSEDDEAAVSITPQVTDLSVSNTIHPTNANPGDTVIITVEVINNGTENATNVAVENRVPSGFTIGTVNDGGTQSGHIISWDSLDIPNGTSAILTFEVTINVPTGITGEYVNTVQVTHVDQWDPDSAPNNDDGDQSEDDEDNAEIILVPADLSLTKTLSVASNQNPNAGDTVVFELTLTNTGPGLATNVTVEDRIPSGFTIGSVDNGGLQNGNQITWSVPSLAVGSQTFTYEATINVPANVLGEYTNTAQVMTSDQFDPDSTPNNDDGDQSEDDEARYTVDAPTVDIEVGKTVDKSRTFHGDTVVFTVTAINNSSYDASNVGIEDVLPSGYILVSHTADSGAYNQTTATWEIASIGTGETATLEMTVTVTETEDYTNIAQLIYVDQIDPNFGNDRAEATPEVTQDECLTVFNQFSPNGDGANDVFFIECIENYPNSLVQVYNRWGNEVFAAKGYDNSWDGTLTKGGSIGASDKLPVGTYYYILQPNRDDVPAKSGWLYISR